MTVLQGGLPIGVSGALLIAAGGIILSLLLAAWRISSALSEVSTKLDGVNDVQKLTAQIEMTDASATATIPDDISAMRDDLDEVTENVSTVDQMVNSVDTIERSVTTIDFEGIEMAIDDLVDGGLPTGNSVEYELEESGVTVAISLSTMEDERTEVNFRFEENVGTRRLAEPIVEDEELQRMELELFGAEPELHAISPRQIEATVPSSGLDAVGDWAAFLARKFDEYYVELHESKSEFDRVLEDSLDRFK